MMVRTGARMARAQATGSTPQAQRIPASGSGAAAAGDAAPPATRTVHLRRGAALGLTLALCAVASGCSQSSSGTAASTAASTATWRSSAPATSAAPSATASSPATATTPSTPATTSAAASSAPASSAAASGGSCQAMAAAMPLDQRVGQLYMVGLDGPQLGRLAAAQLSDLHLGSALILTHAPSGTAAASAMAGAAAQAGGSVPVLVSVDQEGGRVQRLTGPGFSTIPSATQQATMSDAALTQAWKQWGSELASAGVRYDLAPDADLVTPGNVQRNAPVGQLRRNYGTTSGEVSQHVAAVVAGLHSAGVASSAKHFPGLGAVTTNTDFGVAVDTTTTTSSAVLDDFRAAMRAGVSSVMVSSAIYRMIDPSHPAMFSSTIINGLLRGQLGWQGVVISDDLGAAGAVASVPAAERGTAFLAAGGDIALDASSQSIRAMVSNTLARAQSDQGFAQQVTQKAARVLALKASVGQVACTA